MNSSDTKFSSVTEYIATFSPAVRKILKEIRAVVRATAPEAVESISYGMPAYKLHGKPLVYFAAFQHHIGFYATPSGHVAFKKELAKYVQGKGSVQFPLEKKIPISLIRRMVKYNATKLRHKK